MGKAQKQRAGRKKLRDAYEKLKIQQGAVEGTAAQDGSKMGVDDVQPEVGNLQSRASKIERRAKRRSSLMEKLEAKSLGIRKQSMKKKKKNSVFKRKAFSFESLLSELGEIDRDLHVKAEKRDTRLRDFNRHRNRQRMMVEFSRKMSEVNSNPHYQNDPLGTAMRFLEDTLPIARTREQVDSEWRKQQRKIEKEKKKQKPIS